MEIFEMLRCENEIIGMEKYICEDFTKNELRRLKRSDFQIYILYMLHVVTET